VKTSLLPLFLLLFLSAAVAQGRQPGINQVQAEVQAEQAKTQPLTNIPSPALQRPHTDYAKVGHEADELSKIAQTIPSDVDQIAKGVFPKDVIEKLKRIEKLSKQLRSELNP